MKKLIIKSIIFAFIFSIVLQLTSDLLFTSSVEIIDVDNTILNDLSYQEAQNIMKANTRKFSKNERFLLFLWASP